MHIVKVPEWARYGWLRHGFSTRLGGVSTVYGGSDLNLGFTKDDDRAAVEQNRSLFLQAIDASSNLATLRQVHGTHVAQVTEPGPAGEADGLMTVTPGLSLGILTADCTPVLVADTRQRIVAGFHAGWRGTAAAIVESGVRKLIATHNSDPANLIAAVGPAIGVCCYTVGQEVQDRFAKRFSYSSDLFSTSPAGLHVNLHEANRRQLLAAGVAAENITMLAECTACSRLDGQRKFFSHRDEKGFTGRMMSVIAISAT